MLAVLRAGEPYCAPAVCAGTALLHQLRTFTSTATSSSSSSHPPPPSTHGYFACPSSHNSPPPSCTPPNSRGISQASQQTMAAQAATTPSPCSTAPGGGGPTQPTGTSSGASSSHQGARRPPAAAFTSQRQLVEALAQQGGLSPRCFEALAAVDRRHYVHAYKGIPDMVAYMDTAVAAGCGQVLPPPSVCGQMLAALEPYVPPGARLLDVGSGTGYMTALLAVLAGPQGYVLALDKQAKLVEQSRANLLNSALPGLALSSPRGSPQQQPGVPAPDAGVAAGSATAGSGSQGVEGAAAAGKGGEGRSGTARGGGCRVEVLVDNVMSDNSLLLDPGLAPFHVIHLGAALTDLDLLPPWLPRLLRPGGRLVAPYGEPHRHQLLVAIDRDHSGRLQEAAVLGKLSCRFGPLTEYYDDHVQ